MPHIDNHVLKKFTFDIYRALGSPDKIANVASEYQIDTNLYGHDSHGCVSIPRFYRDVLSGKIIPDAEPEVMRAEGPTALMNGSRLFGQYAAGDRDVGGTELALGFAEGRQAGFPEHRRRVPGGSEHGADQRRHEYGQRIEAR